MSSFNTSYNLDKKRAETNGVNTGYDIRGLSSRSKETCDGLEGSTEIIRELIKKEADAGIPYSRIVVSGFSQGGAMSL